MRNKTINTDKSWWAKTPNRELELIELAGLTGGHKYDFSGHYGEAMKVYYNKRQNSAYIQKSVIMKTMKIRPRRSTTINKVLSNPWLFYTMPLHENSDVLLQPIFDMTKMTETRFNNMLKAVYEQNMKKLLKLCPNILPTPEEYSKGLYSEEEMSDRIDLGNAAETECQEAVARQAIDRREPVSRQPRDTQNGHSLIIGSRRDIEGEKEKEKENRELNIEGKKDIGPIVRETEPEPSLPRYQKTELDVITKERTWGEYLDNLKVDSKEIQSLLPYAEEDRPMIENNFEQFIFHLKNRCTFRKKDESECTKSDAGKNEYIYTLLKNKSERRNLVKHIQDSIAAKRRSEFTYGKPGFPHDFYNKQGQRISSGNIVPDDAPPRPSDEHFWNGTKWIHR